MTTRRRIASVFTALALAGGVPAARAAGVVGTGTAGSCTPAALVAALSGGGTVTFDCGPDPATIVLPARQTIAADTTLDGGGRIRLSGAGAHGLFTVPSGRTLTLQQLTLREAGTENWAVFVSDGAALLGSGLVVEACTRGGIYNAGGTVQVTDAAFTENDAGTAGAAITNENGGHLTVLRATFVGNLNGAVFSTGPATITDAVFFGNGGDSAGGGALLATHQTTIERCHFEKNSATAGGAIYTSGELTVRDSTFRRNTSTLFDGGAIQLYNQTQTPSSVTVRASTFDENAAARAGGGIRCDAPNGTCTLENVTFSRDVAGKADTGAELSLKSGVLQATHVTVLAGGSPAVERVAGSLTLRNSIVADGTCVGGLTDAGGNVQGDPDACGFPTGDAALFALAGNGGWTGTHEIGVTSAALHLGAAGCLPTDQRGVARPATGCDAGAFQRGATPTITLLAPDHTAAGGPSFSMIVMGSSFLTGPFPTRVLWNGTELPSTVTSPTEILVEVPATLIATAGVAQVTVETPDPPVPDGGPAATSLPFTIDEATPPPPPPPPPPAGPCDGLASWDAVLCAIDQARAPGHFCAAPDLDPKLDKALQTALGKTRTAVAAARAASAKKAPRLLRRAKAQLTKLGRRATSKRAGTTTPACRSAVADGAATLATGVAGLAQ